MVLVILDIDNTLVHTVDKKCLLQEWIPNFIAYDWADQIVFCRPYLKNFLDELYSIKGIEVGIFTAAQEDYANVIVNTIFKDRKLEFVLSRMDFIDCNMKTGEYKSINYVHYRFPQYSFVRTIIIDDHPGVKQTNGENCYYIPAFTLFKGIKDSCINNSTSFYNQLSDMQISKQTLVNWYNTSAVQDIELLKAVDYIKMIK